MTKTSNSSRYNDREDGELNINASFTLLELELCFFYTLFPTHAFYSPITVLPELRQAEFGSPAE